MNVFNSHQPKYQSAVYFFLKLFFSWTFFHILYMTISISKNDLICDLSTSFHLPPYFIWYILFIYITFIIIITLTTSIISIIITINIFFIALKKGGPFPPEKHWLLLINECVNNHWPMWPYEVFLSLKRKKKWNKELLGQGSMEL